MARGGGILTEFEMRRAIGSKGSWGTPRDEGQEFVVIWTPEPVASAQLIVVLPPEYAPEGRPLICVTRLTCPAGSPYQPIQKKQSLLEEELPELPERLSVPSRGKFVVVPCPRPHWDYMLSWNPIDDAEVTKLTANELHVDYFTKVATDDGEYLLGAFADVFRKAKPFERVTLALYIKKKPPPSNLTLLQTAWRPLGLEKDLAPKPPLQIKFQVSARPPLLLGGDSPRSSLGRRTKPRRRPLVFHPQERALLGVPIRFGLGGTMNPLLGAWCGSRSSEMMPSRCRCRMKAL